MFFRNEWAFRAGRTFLQTASGVLASWLTASALGILPALAAWKAAVITLAASLTATLLSAVMNHISANKSDN